MIGNQLLCVNIRKLIHHFYGYLFLRFHTSHFRFESFDELGQLRLRQLTSFEKAGQLLVKEFDFLFDVDGLDDEAHYNEEHDQFTIQVFMFLVHFLNNLFANHNPEVDYQHG